MKKKNNDFEVIYFGEDEIIIEEDKRKKYPFLLFFFKYGRLITMLFASISILTFIGGVALTLSSIPKIKTPDIKADEGMVMEFDGVDNSVDLSSGKPITKDKASELFNNNSGTGVVDRDYMKATNIIVVGEDKVIYFDNGSAVIIYGDKSKLPVYVENANNVSIDNNNKSINVKGDTVKTAKKSVLDDGMVVYEFENDKLMTELNDNYKLYNKNKGNSIAVISVGDNKVVYFDNGDTVVVYSDKMPVYVKGLDNVKINNNNININGDKIVAGDKRVLPDGSNLYDFSNNKTLVENKDKDNYKLIDTDKIIYDKDGNIKDNSNNNGIGNVGSENSLKQVGNDLVLYFDNGSAVVIYGDKSKLPVYVVNKNDVDTTNIPLVINGDKVDTVNKKVLDDGTIIYEFGNDKALVEKDGKYKLVDKNNLVFDNDGNLVNEDDNDDISFKEFNIKNNSDEKLKYRIVIEESNDYGNKGKLLPQYIYQKISIDGFNEDSLLLNSNPWAIGSTLENGLMINNTTYVLYEGEIESNSIVKVKLALWTDYDTIPNEMQDKWFIGTIKLYGWE